MPTATRSISDFMTKSPQCIGVEQSIATAKSLMRKRRVRHLPVLHGGRLVGLLSLRDIHLVETFRDVDPEEVSVEEAMSAEVYEVPPSAPLVSAAREMAKRKLGSAVVVQSGKVVGMFTTVDALNALASIGRS